MVYELTICLIAGIGAGLRTGSVGMSAVAAISPMLATFLHIDPYEAIDIALASNVPVSVVSVYTYGKNEDLDTPNGSITMVVTLCFVLVDNWVSSLVLSTTASSSSIFMTLLPGIKFIVKPVTTTKEFMAGVSRKKRIVQSIICGIMVGFICDFVGADDGVIILLIPASVLGYELKTAVGTSVFIMTFTTLAGALSHFATGGAPDIMIPSMCVLSTLLWARIAARFANCTSPIALNRATDVVLAVLGVAILAANYSP